MSQPITVKSESLARVSSVNSCLMSAAQRSAHELPMVERQDIDSCLVYGGQQMILTGQNFTAESKVVFTEKTTGRTFQLVRVPWPCKSHLLLVPSITDLGWILSRRLANSALSPPQDKSPMPLVILMLTQFTIV